MDGNERRELFAFVSKLIKCFLSLVERLVDFNGLKWCNFHVSLINIANDHSQALCVYEYETLVFPFRKRMSCLSNNPLCVKSFEAY